MKLSHPICHRGRKYQLSLIRIVACILLFRLPAFSMFPTSLLQPGSEQVMADQVFVDFIRTVMLGSAAWGQALPVAELGKERQLELIFDDLSLSGAGFGYAIRHCSMSWKLSSLSQMEYLSGFGQGIIRESSPSSGTIIPYIHYRLLFPEQEAMPVVSGNYVIIVYNLEDPETPVLVRRFYVLEEEVAVSGTVISPPHLANDGMQQVDFSLLSSSTSARGNEAFIRVMIMQNGDHRSIRQADNLVAATDGRLIPGGSRNIQFPAGNEFRSMDLKSLGYVSERVETIEFRNSAHVVTLKKDETRESGGYFRQDDLNGRYLVEKEKADDASTEADYADVHFRLYMPFPLAGKDVYVDGMLTGWQTDEWNRMRYDPEDRCYHAVIRLKQGWYNYRYVAAGTGSATDSLFSLEGNYSETGNDYYIFVYISNPGERYDRLIGFTVLHSA